MTAHTDFQDPPHISIDLEFYGIYVGSGIAKAPYPPLGQFAYLGAYRRHLMLATAITGLVAWRRVHRRRARGDREKNRTLKEALL